MDLNDKKRELEVLKKELKAMEEERKKNPNNASFNLQVNLKRGRVNKLTGEIAILDKMDELERKYKNKEVLYFRYKDNSVFNKVLCEFGSDNYEKAYFQQRKLLELELNYYLAMPINGIKYGKPGYDDLYVQSRNILFDLKSYENSNVSKEEDIKPRPRHFKDEDLGPEPGSTEETIIVKNFNEASRKVKITSYSDIDSKETAKFQGTIREGVYTYYEYIQFKRAYFDCKNVEYDSNTGRITKMDFEFTGKFN